MSTEKNTNTRWIRRVWNWLKGWMQRHKIISGLVLIYAVWQAVMTPIFNPFASDAYTIRGRFPFDQGFELQFIQNAYGNSTWYRRWCGGIQTDNAICRAGHRVLKPTRLEGQNYEIKIYRDRYFFGLADWQEETWHVEYKANKGLDPMKVMAHAYANDENSACNGSEESIKRHEGRLFCMGQIDHKKYKHLVITEGLPLKPNEQLMNFWLYTELDALFVKEKSQ